MSTNGGSARDPAARRRRIAERGAERLALITGRVQPTSLSPLPPSSSVAQSHQSSTTPSPPSVPQNPDQLPVSDENKNDSISNTETPTNDIINEIQPLILNKTTTEIPTQPFSPPTPTPQPPPISTSQKSNLGQTLTLTPNKLRPAITSSQNTRTLCSIISALLVLLSYANFPILNNNIIKSIILSRPLVLLILTNVTIVAAPVLLEKVNQKEQRGSLSSDQMGIGMALEWIMLMKTGFTALFMDCSVYSVVLVCGMSFLKKFGW